MKSCELELDLVIIEVKEDKADNHKNVEQLYKKLDEKCDIILEKIKSRKKTVKK